MFSLCVLYIFDQKFLFGGDRFRESISEKVNVYESSETVRQKKAQFKANSEGKKMKYKSINNKSKKKKI